MTLDQFNQLPFDDAKTFLLGCCGSDAWAVEMTAGRPYATMDLIQEAAARQWWRLGEYGWLQAVRTHPHVRETPVEADASEEVSNRIAALQREYYATFGFGFVLYGAGKSVDDVLAALLARVENRPEEELANAAGEQSKITHARLTRRLDCVA